MKGRLETEEAEVLTPGRLGIYWLRQVLVYPEGAVPLRRPSLEGIGTPWVCDQESRQHPVLVDIKPKR